MTAATTGTARSGTGTADRTARPRRTNWIPTLILLIGAVYCVLPVVWIVIASTKTNSELFSTAPFAPSFHGGFFSNLRALFSYDHGIFIR